MPSVPASNCHDLDALRLAIASGAQARFVFFWSHRAPSSGGISAACLSQWYEAPFRLGGQTYPTAEHFMMAEKARLFSDHQAERRVMEAREPGAARAVGREVRGFVEEVWVQHRFDIAVLGNRAKFEQGKSLASFLRGTTKRVLAEASPVDRIWGIGLEAGDPRAVDPNAWQGLNLLGFALMKVRDEMSAA
ncbi:MAG: NADAR family protein [Myxococcota bacterium]